VFETPHSDESAPSRTSASWPQPGQGSPGGGCALRVVPGAVAHTKGVTGRPVTTTWRAGGVNAPSARYLTDRELRSRKRVWGQAPFSGRQPVYGSKQYEWVKGTDVRSRYRHSMGNGNAGIQRARRLGPPKNLRSARTRGSEVGKRAARYSARQAAKRFTAFGRLRRISNLPPLSCWQRHRRSSILRLVWVQQEATAAPLLCLRIRLLNRFATRRGRRRTSAGCRVLPGIVGSHETAFSTVP